MKSIAPPVGDWQEISYKRGAGGTISFFYSDDLSKFPVRAVTKVGDNKADPNIETLTYGLFSTCQKDLRCSIINNGKQYLFFICRRNNIRVLVGFYSIKWFTSVVNSGKNDFAIAADDAHFVANPYSLETVDRECGANINRRFRLTLSICDEDCIKIKNLLLKQPNSITSYIAEIHRLERFNRAQGGHLYIGRKLDQEYSWDMAASYILQNNALIIDNSQIKNSSPSDWWTCQICGHDLKNKALLRICPNCNLVNTLIPLNNAPD